MYFKWFIVFAASVSLLGVDCQSGTSNNSPPSMTTPRKWTLWDDQPINTSVITVIGRDDDNDQLTYSLEPAIYGGETSLPLPFYINNRTGEVFVNESLKDRGGQTILFTVVISDGHFSPKTEVIVEINKRSGEPNTEHTRLPQFPNQHGSLRPSFKPPNLPNFPLPSLPLPQPAPPTPLSPPTGSVLPGGRPKTTKLQPENTDHRETEDPGGIKSKKTTEQPSVHANEIEGPALSSKVTPAEVPKSQDLAMTLIPISAIFALVIGLSMGIWSFRSKLCGTGKGNSKEQASVSVSNISDDPSLVLKRWRGPKAANNRYEAWEKENSNIQRKSDDKWEFPRHRLKIFCILGEGCFGQVWKCEALDIDGKAGTTIVAVKTLKENATERERLDLAQELRVMKTLEPHPNVVRLLGCCTEREPMFVILEYVGGGKLQSFLRASREERNHGGPGLTSRDLTGFVYQVAKGMEYLASKGIIHRDLAARNILIDESRACKVADFGFARDIAANQIYERKSEGRLPIRWMAPESLYDNVFSVKSDVWSFGVLIWEIVTLGSTPYPGLAAAEVMRRIKDGHRLDRPEHCKRELYNIMYYCWDKDPASRPSFSELVSLAEGLLLDETDYIELDRFPDHSYYNVLNLSGEKL